ncbi:MAG: hypothetical protein LBR84_09610 [Tannerella sp.]|jgi:beta-lactamase superfamily II metal-dependent hydrolase|nr:hypothetical protein [Tannerella sp.]
MNRRKFLLTAPVLGLLGRMSASEMFLPAEETAAEFADWREGWLDIHHISTGRGNAAFIICPDGTTILIDAGDLGAEVNPNHTPHIPDDSKRAGEWIAEYIRRFSKPLKNRYLDYAFLTHFHDDHIGAKYDGLPEPNGYALTGIADVAEQIDIKMLIDRGYPDYNYPSRERAKRANRSFFDDYLKFVEYQRTNKGVRVEMLDAGSDRQIVLKNAPSEYPDFKVQNIYVNGQAWTGEGRSTRSIFTDADTPDENQCSGAIRLQYGRFGYWSGGDCNGVERQICDVIRPTTVFNVNHHANGSPQTEFLAAMRPQVMIVPVWDLYHPKADCMERMIDRTIYPDDRLIFATARVNGIEKLLGDNIKHFQPLGHIVVRVTDSGSKYKVYVLDAMDKNCSVKMETRTLQA